MRVEAGRGARELRASPPPRTQPGAHTAPRRSEGSPEPAAPKTEGRERLRRGLARPSIKGRPWGARSPRRPPRAAPAACCLLQGCSREECRSRGAKREGICSRGAPVEPSGTGRPPRGPEAVGAPRGAASTGRGRAALNGFPSPQIAGGGEEKEKSERQTGGEGGGRAARPRPAPAGIV